MLPLAAQPVDLELHHVTGAQVRLGLGLAQAQRAALAEPDASVAALLLEGVVLRLQADLRWLEACARYWAKAKDRG